MMKLTLCIPISCDWLSNDGCRSPGCTIKNTFFVVELTRTEKGRAPYGRRVRQNEAQTFSGETATEHEQLLHPEMYFLHKIGSLISAGGICGVEGGAEDSPQRSKGGKTVFFHQYDTHTALIFYNLHIVFFLTQSSCRES